jgi:hypothetical protein
MKLIKVSTLAVLALSLMAFRPYTEIPHKIEMIPGDAGAGQTVTIRVEMTGVVAEDTPVAISVASSFWSSMPAQVTVDEGEDDVTFQATIATSPSGSNRVTASANGGSVFFDVPL